MGLLVLKILIVWVIIVCAAFANAALRELILAPHLGKIRALTLSGLLLLPVIVLIAYACLPWIGARQPAELLTAGSVWMILTATFDLVLGRLQGKPVMALLEAYTFRGGSLWPVVLVVTLAAPYAAARLRDWV